MELRGGYTILILVVMVSVLAIGLLAAVPLWRTEIRREAEEELIFRGLQYVEAVRLYQMKNPGSFPKSVDDLIKGRFLRRAYRDPMTRDGRWDYILQADAKAGGSGPTPPAGAAGGSVGASTQRVLVVPEESLSSVDNPRLIGVVSRSPRSSIRIYDDADTYDAWLFFLGRNPEIKVEIIRFGRADR